MNGKPERGFNPPPYVNETINPAVLWQLLLVLDDWVDASGERFNFLAGAELIAVQARSFNDAFVSRVICLAQPVAEAFRHPTPPRRIPPRSPAQDGARHDGQPATAGPRLEEADRRRGDRGARHGATLRG
jgi:hypothetical protein